MSTSSAQKIESHQTLSNNEEESFKDIISESKFKTSEQNELEMQAQRIIYIFDKAIYKIRIVALLPCFLLCDGKILRKYLPNRDVDLILAACKKYEELKPDSNVGDQQDDSSTSSSALSEDTFFVSVMKDMKGKLEIPHGRVLDKRTSQMDINITRAIDLIFFCEPLRFDLESYDKYTDEKVKTLIEIFKTLRDTAHRHLIMTAAKEASYQKNLKQYYRENKDTMIEIEKLQALLDKQRLELGNQIEERNRQIEQCLIDIDELQANIRNNIKQIVKSSEKTMVQKTIASDAIRVIVAEQAKLTKEHYTQLLETHLNEEKVLRIKLDKVEVQLSQWLAKYDQEIGDRQTVREELQKEYNDDREEIETISELIMQQDGLYTALMVEKDREEHEANMAIAEEHCRHRAATIIQKCWKDYKLRKWMRKMAKKAKKMKKVEEKVVETPIEIDTTGLFDDLPGGDNI